MLSGKRNALGNSMKLYKYTKLEYALDIIDKERLYLSRPEDFNDPFDCVLSTDRKARRDAAELISNYTLFENVYNFVSKNINQITINKDEILRIFEHGNTLKVTLNLYPRYGLWTDMGEFAKNYKEQHYKEFDDQCARYQYYINRVMESIRHNTLIYCFTINNNSLLMWSHYADSHKGVCIEFEVELTEKDLIGVKYSDKKANFDIYTVASLILAHEFIKKPISTRDQEFNKIIMKPFYTKSKEWSYEQEIRYIFSEKSPERVFVEKGNYYVKSPKIKSITFGCRVDMNDPSYKKIIEVCGKKGILTRYLETSEESYSLEEK